MPDEKKRKKDAKRQMLKAAFPMLHAELQAGRIASLHEALRLAGLDTPKPRLPHLQKIWGKATDEEQRAFTRWLVAAGALPEPTGTIATGRYLLPDTVSRLETIMKRRGITPGAVMAEMGFDPADPSLALAMARNSSLRLVVIAGLGSWLAANTDP